MPFILSKMNNKYREYQINTAKNDEFASILLFYFVILWQKDEKMLSL